MVKFIVVTGGVISGVGKGLTASSIGAILKSHDKSVTPVKIDPYLNVDAGTFSPHEHGEVFVLEDGSEVDLDLGNYERFLDTTLSSRNSLTTGKVYLKVINRERAGKYLGQTVQVVPHITDEIIRSVMKATETVPKIDFCVIEVGGVIGDIESSPFIEAMRLLQMRIPREDFCSVHESNGELKTKPTQMSVQMLRAKGIVPDFVICRTKVQISDDIKRKLSIHCQVPTSNIIEIPDCQCIYEIPIKLFQQNFLTSLEKKLEINFNTDIVNLSKWINLTKRWIESNEELNIGLVGKYMKLEDAYHSVLRSLQHACLNLKKKLNLHFINSSYLGDEMKDSPEYSVEWNKIKAMNGIIVPGGFGGRAIEGIVCALRYSRENKIPTLGICLGLQIMVIEFARSIGMTDANSTEFSNSTSHPVVINMNDFCSTSMGATMRLGKYKTKFVSGQSLTSTLYGCASEVEERHRHRYEVNPKYVSEIQKAGLNFVGVDESGERMEVAELHGYIFLLKFLLLKDHPFYIGVQFHPEFTSRPNKPNPLFYGFAAASAGMMGFPPQMPKEN